MDRFNRRSFVRGSVASALGTSIVANGLPRLSAEDVQVPPEMVRFHPEIEPLVRLLEETPRDQIVDRVLDEIRAGRTYQQLLAALLLAGIRNVQPRPSVGFKFHCVLVVYSAHQASMAAKDEGRWLPLLWAIDYFKSAQQSDRNEGDWTMTPAPADSLPSAHLALRELDRAFSDWDEARADSAATVAAREASAGQLFDLMARNSARDFRNIGHKAIYCAGAFRTLQVIGWQHAEPVMRSLAYAILNHTGDPNPSSSDLEADRAGRLNWELVTQLRDDWRGGQRTPEASLEILTILRQANPQEAAAEIVAQIKSGVHPDSLYDGVLLAASELVTRQSAIVPLHAVTTSNAMRYLYRTVQDDSLRRWLLLQNASFLAHFRVAAEGRGQLRSWQLDALQPSQESEPTVATANVFDNIGRDNDAAAQSVLAIADDPLAAVQLMSKARELVFLKGNDSHDYKFSSAAIEDYHTIDPRWRGHYLAACSPLLHANHERTTPLAEKVLAAFS